MIDSVAAMENEAAATEAIREVCQHTRAEGLWEALEAKGIDTTPGVIYQIFNKPNHPEPTAAAPSEARGLSPDDLVVLSELAGKVGGVQQLIRILEVWQDIPK